jgi:signal transduction histidine kinase
MIECSISDNGIGIPEEIASTLFNLNKKNIGVGTDNEHGSGLGLILCKEYAEKNGGNIWFNTELDKGTTFYFTVPINK